MVRGGGLLEGRAGEEELRDWTWNTGVFSWECFEGEG